VKTKSQKKARRKERWPREGWKDGGVHFRLCHFCLHLNEASQEIGQCRKCRRHLTIGAMLKDVTPEEVAEAWINEGYEGSEEEAEDMAADELQEMEKNHPRAGSVQFDPDTQSERSVPHLTGLSVIW
jgi:hypothetical protein